MQGGMECACLLSACGARGRAPDRALCRRTLRLAVGALALAVLASVAAEASVNYYSLLGVRRTADTATIKKAYKDMARKYHPDKYKGPSPVKMEDLNRAHEVLTDPDLRKKYDMYGKDPEDFDVQRAEDRRQRQQEFAQFGNMFGRRQHQNIESQTQTLTMHNYEELVNGLRQIWVIQVWRDNSCPHCHEIAPAWEEAAKELKGVVNFGRVNYERNGALLQFRLRQLPTIYCVTSSGEIRLMPSRHGYSAEEIVKFASGIVTSTSSVEKIDARGSAQRFLARPATSDKVHVILFDRGDWAAYHSAAMAPAWKDSMVFAVFSRPTLTDAFTRQFDVNPDERTVVVVREDGSSRKKTGMRSRKVLVRFLLQNQWPLVAKVTAQNWAQVCLGLGGATTGLHTLEHLVPSKRTDNRVCVLSMRNASSEKLRPELPVLRDAARSLADRDESVQFGWLVIERSDRLWQFLLAKNMVAQSQHETVAMIDWQRGWCKTVGTNDLGRLSDAQWLLAWVNQGLKEMQETGEEVPAVALQWTPAEKLFNMFSRESIGGAGGGAGGSDGEGGKGDGSKAGWSTWMGMVFVCLALVNYLTSQASSGSQQRTSSQGRQGGSGGEQGQQGARQSTPQPEADAGAQSCSSAASSGGDSSAHRSSHTSSGVNSSPRSPGAAGGSARGAQDEGPRQRPAAAGSAGSGKDDLTNRLGNCSVSLSRALSPAARVMTKGYAGDEDSVGELRRFAEQHKINISDCFEKDEIVKRIMRSL